MRSSGGHHVRRVGRGGSQWLGGLALASGARVQQVHAGVRQRLSVVLMRENGRALLAVELSQGLGRAELEAGGDPA